MDKRFRAGLLQTMLSQDEGMSEYNIFRKALSLIRAGEVSEIKERVQIALDVMTEVYSEDELAEYMDMVNSHLFMRMRLLLSKFESNFNEKVQERERVRLRTKDDTKLFSEEFEGIDDTGLFELPLSKEELAKIKRDKDTQ